MASHDFDAWRAQVDKELAGAPFEKLIRSTAEGLALEPLYVEEGPPPGLPGAAPFVRGAEAAGATPRTKLCMRLHGGWPLEDDLDGGADALWIGAGEAGALAAATARGCELLVETDSIVAELPGAHVIANDPIGRAARGTLPVERLRGVLAALGGFRLTDGVRLARVSGVPFHDAGADAADELALALSAGVAVLRAFDAAGVALADANRALVLQLAVGRDTFGEVCKLRAARACWHRMLAAAGAPHAPPPPIHAVCSERTVAARDPWVNMLRVTTQVFAAVLGGAAWVTPVPFDRALAPSTEHDDPRAAPLSRRVARNTVLVLRDESHLGRVVDAAGGSYYLEARTDALARAAWSRFRAIEGAGGVVALLERGELGPRLAAAWAQRAAAIARRKEPLLGVSEFANLDEALPGEPVADTTPPAGALPRHRDAEGFEALRARVDAGPRRDAVLLTLGLPAEHRARAGYASALLAAAGLRAREVSAPCAADLAVLCGSDERYAAEAAAAARALRAAGARRVILAGRPGALEAGLREAGVDAFVFVGADVLATLREVLS